MIQTITSQLYASYSSFFQPLLALEPHIALGVFAVTLAGLYSIVHWYVGDHEKIASIKENMEQHQSKAKETEDEEEAARHQKKAISLQQKMMVANFKPILVIMVFSILFFPWMRATYSPTVQMNKTGNNTYKGQITYAGRQDRITVGDSTPTVVKTQNQEAKIGESVKDVGVKWQVQNFKKNGQEAKLSLNADFIDLPISLPLVGNAVNWLGFYILLSIPSSNIFRRILGIA